MTVLLNLMHTTILRSKKISNHLFDSSRAKLFTFLRHRCRLQTSVIIGVAVTPEQIRRLHKREKKTH